MTSLELVKDQIEKFLKTNTPEVLALRGAWGIGKTFAWSKFLKEAQKNKSISFQKYSYVSLFGINSLDDLKFAIFEETTNLTGEEITKDSTIKSKLTRLWGLAKSPSVIKDVTGALGIGDSTIRSLAFSSIEKTIICIDDFERKGGNLCAQDVLGLISMLKEQKNCKIMLILNDEALQDKAIIDYQKYREKVIDKELEFRPTPAECASIALGTDEISSKIKGFCEKLEISNIRIIKKIERLAREIEPTLKNFEPEVMNGALSSLVLFSWSFYNKTNPEVPDFDYIKKYNHIVSIWEERDNKNKEENPQEAKWKAALRKYDYGHTDDIDLEIAEAVKRGYINKEALQEHAKELHEDTVASKARQNFHKVWRIFHDSFDNNEQEVIDALYNAVKDNVMYIGTGDVNSVVITLQQLGQAKKAEEIMDFYLSKRKDEAGFTDHINDSMFGSGVSDKVFKQKLSEISKIKKPKKTLLEVLDSLSNKNGWNQDEEDFLVNTTVDEYYKFFKETKGKMSAQYVDVCLKFGRFVNPSENYLKISNNAKDALKRISTESQLNKMRMEKFNLNFEKQTAETNVAEIKPVKKANKK